MRSYSGVSDRRGLRRALQCLGWGKKATQFV